MLTRRIIPCLDVLNGRVVKGRQFVDLVDVGDPLELAARYSASGADEIVLLDISATLEGRKPFMEIVERVAAEVATLSIMLLNSASTFAAKSDSMA